MTRMLIGFLLGLGAFAALGAYGVYGPSGQVLSAQGNGAKMQLSTGATTSGDLTKFDANGNTVDASLNAGYAAAMVAAQAKETVNAGSFWTPDQKPGSLLRYRVTPFHRAMTAIAAMSTYGGI